ncbi:WD40 repeat protein [Batrachochytrium dendrobatidis]
MYFAIGTPRILSERLAEPDCRFTTSGTVLPDNHHSNRDNTSDNHPTHDSSKNNELQKGTRNEPLTTILAIRKCPLASLFASITFNSVSIWSIRPDVQLSKVTRTLETVREDGENVDLLWKPDGSTLVVLTNEGFLHFYDVVELESPLFGYHFRSTHHMASGPGESKSTTNRILRFRMALEIDSGTQCGIGLDDDILICTNNPPSILSLHWTGEVNIPGTISLEDLDFFLDKNDSLVQIVSHPSRQLFGFVSLEGKAYIGQRSIFSGDMQGILESQTDQQHKWTGYCFYNKDGDRVPAASIAFNPTFTLVAVGTLQGVVYVFELSEDLLTATQSHVMAITMPGNNSTPISLSVATALSWTQDGYALAVAWIYGGMSVWSVYGSLLMSTISEDTFVHSADGIVSNTNEIFFTGTQDLFWSESGHDLFILPSSTFEKESVSDIYVLQFAKASILTCDSWSNSRHICLLLDDRLLMYEGLHSDTNVTSLDPMGWETIQIPNVYISDNWPIRYVSLNSSGKFIAIAGKRGLAHYNTFSGKWKLFGNEHQEQGFTVQGGILWFRSMLIVACQDVISYSSEIRVFSRTTKLDNSMILHIEKLQHPVLTMNNTDSHLLLYCADHVVRYFSIHILPGDQRVQLQPQQAFSMQDIISGWGDIVQAVARFPPPGVISIETMTNNPFVILRNGALHMISKRGDSWEAIKIASHTEHFWISAHEDEVEEFSNTMWAFSGRTVKILTNIIIDPIAGTDHSFLDTALDISVDFYPLTVLIQKGLLVGIEKQLSLNSTLDVSQFSTDTKSYLFLHFIIRHLLMLGLEQKAITFCSNYQDLEYFSHSLEVLLHTVLEDNSESDQKKSTAVGIESHLTQIVRFIKRFPKSLEIIVNCARKSEMAMWNYFFAAVGDPITMFETCLDEGLLGTATSYLIVIQTLRSSSVSTKLAIQLLKKSFDLKDYETGSELVRFLKSIKAGEHPMMQETANDDASSVTDILDLTALEQLVKDQTKTILESQQYRDLGHFAALFQIDLGAWLLTEREKTKVLIFDWFATLMALHKHFSLGLPNEFNAVVSSAYRLTWQQKAQGQSLTNDTEPSQNLSASRRARPPPSSRQTTRKPANRRELEIRALMKASIEGEFVELALLLGALLLDSATLISLLDEHPDLVDFFREALNRTKCRGYRQLYKCTMNV